MTSLFRNGDQDVAVSVRLDDGYYRVSIDGRELEAKVQRQGQMWVVSTPEGPRRFAALVTPDACQVFSEGRVYSFPKVDSEQDEVTGDGTAGPRLVADMPGKVVKVLVAPGDQVAAGQGLIIMESMKMETELMAAVTGIVSGVEVTEGQIVGQGDLLVEIAVEDISSES